MLEKFQGCLLGLACGDAVSTTVEFQHRGNFQPVTDMVGAGPYNLQPGEWTDDTSMALCLGESLLETGSFNPKDQINRCLRWYREGYLSSIGRCFDIGSTVREALERYERSGDPFSGSTDPRTAGNGSIMHLAPVPMLYQENYDQVIHYSAESSKTTHGTKEALDACRLFGLMIAMALDGHSKEEILFGTQPFLPPQRLAPKLQAIQAGSYQQKPEQQIDGSGYTVECLEAALWSFYHTESFKEAILKAVNLGNDADTTGEVVGQIAGAFYGIQAIPNLWIERLAMSAKIQTMAEDLYRHKTTTPPHFKL